MLAPGMTLASLAVGATPSTYVGTIHVEGGPELRFHVDEGITEWSAGDQPYPLANIPVEAFGFPEDDGSEDEIEQERAFVARAETLARDAQAAATAVLHAQSRHIVEDANSRSAA